MTLVVLYLFMYFFCAREIGRERAANRGLQPAAIQRALLIRCFVAFRGYTMVAAVQHVFYESLAGSAPLERETRSDHVTERPTRA